jgi:hypothetical protein
MEKGFKCKEHGVWGLTKKGLTIHRGKFHKPVPFTEQEKNDRLFIDILAQQFAMWNFKMITDDSFRIESNKLGRDYSPNDFFGIFPDQCLAAIREYAKVRLQEQRLKEKRERAERKKKERGVKCICEEENKKEPNAVQAKNTDHPFPIRLWNCPVHKRTASNLGRYTLPNDINPTIERILATHHTP